MGELSPRYQRVAELVNRGYAPRQIEVELGINRSQLYTSLSYARARKLCETPFKRSVREKIRYLRSKSAGLNQGSGSIQNALESAGVEVAAWVLSQTPKDCTIADTIGSLLIDAYEDQHDEASDH